MEERLKPKKDKFSFQRMLGVLEKEYGGSLSERAKATLREAFNGHRGQFRDSRIPESQLPFIVHPVGTARLAIRYFPSVKNVEDNLDTIICLASVHDLLEDSRVGGSRVEAVAGPKVHRYVEALTKPQAGVAGRSVAQREKELFSRIVRAGPTAVFVKICDSMHNLSHPVATPLDLLSRAVQKAKNQYLPLLKQCPLGEEIERAYSELIAVAEEEIVNGKTLPLADLSFPDLESAVAECIAASKGKILELHDISDILARVCGTKNVSIWRCSGRGENLLSPVVGLQEGTDAARFPTTDICRFPQVFTGPSLDGLPAAFSGCSAVFTVPMQTDPETVFVATLGFSQGSIPVWFSIDSATMLVQFLAHRLIVSETDRRARLAGAATSLGMKLSVELASRIGVQPAELGQLQYWRNRCKQAIAVVEHLIDFLLLSDDPNIPLHKLVRVTSRLKTVDSILRKYLLPAKRVWPEYEKLEDIAGVRVICPTRSGICAIEKFLLSDRASAVGVKLHSIIDEPRRNYVELPTKSGYRAIHLILEVETKLENGGIQRVPCEVQLRTMFQDAWAAISHATLYRASKKKRHHHSEELREVGESLERCEELAEKLVKGE